MLPEKLRRLAGVFFLSIIVVMSGCGGGGDNTKDTPPPPVTEDTPPSPVTGAPENQLPVASAGENVLAYESSVVVLSASESTDPDGTIVRFKWDQVSGPEVQVSDWENESISFVAPVLGEETVYEFKVTVTDDAGDSTSQNVTVTILPLEVVSHFDVKFPPNGSRFFGEAISVLGTIDKDKAELGLVEVKVYSAAGEVSAIVQKNGVFLAQNVPLPSGTSKTSLQVKAFQLGEEVKIIDLTIENSPTLVSPLLAVDESQADSIYALDVTNISNDRLFRLNLASGEIESLLNPPERLSGQPWKIVHDEGHNRILILDVYQGQIDFFDLDSYELGVLSGPSTGDGPMPERAYDFAIDVPRNRVLVVDKINNAVIAVDLLTGDRSILSSNDSVGSGSEFVEPNRITVDSEHNIAYVYSDFSFLSVDLNNGNRSIVSSSSVGNGQTIYYPRSITFDPISNTVPWISWAGDIYQMLVDGGDRRLLSSNGQTDVFAPYISQVLYDRHFDRYLVCDIGSWMNGEDTDTIFSVDKETGERTTLFDEIVGEGPEVGEFLDFFIDHASGNAYLVDFEKNSLQSIDLNNGARFEVSGAARGLGPAIESPRAVAIDSQENVAYLLQSQDVATAVLKIDLSTGDRTVIASESVGTGPAIQNGSGLAYSVTNKKLYLIDGDLQAVLEVDLNNFERKIISSAMVGSGEVLTAPTGIAYDAEHDRIFVSDEGSGSTDSARVFAVDLNSGDRTTIYNMYLGNGPWINSPSDMDVLPGGNSILLRSHYDGILVMDVESGDRRIVSDSSSIGSGEALLNIRSVAVSSDGLIAYYTGGNHEALFAVNMLTGDRAIIAK